MGWFLTRISTAPRTRPVILGSCDSGVPDVLLPDGATLADTARTCGTEQNTGQFVTCVGSAATAAKNAG